MRPDRVSVFELFELVREERERRLFDVVVSRKVPYVGKVHEIYLD